MWSFAGIRLTWPLWNDPNRVTHVQVHARTQPLPSLWWWRATWGVPGEKSTSFVPGDCSVVLETSDFKMFLPDCVDSFLFMGSKSPISVYTRPRVLSHRPFGVFQHRPSSRAEAWDPDPSGEKNGCCALRCWIQRSPSSLLNTDGICPSLNLYLKLVFRVWHVR